MTGYLWRSLRISIVALNFWLQSPANTMEIPQVTADFDDIRLTYVTEEDISCNALSTHAVYGRLVLSGTSTLVWIAGRTPKKSYSIEQEKILDAAFAHFVIESETVMAVMILTEQTLRSYLADGTQYVTSIPFLAASIWPMHAGIFIERMPDGIEAIDSQIPILFTLNHPIAEAKPVYIYQGQIAFSEEARQHVGMAGVNGGAHAQPVQRKHGQIKRIIHDQGSAGAIVMHQIADRYIYLFNFITADDGEDFDLEVLNDTLTSSEKRTSPYTVRTERMFQSAIRLHKVWIVEQDLRS